MRFGYRAGRTGDEQHWGQYHTASPGYFEVLGIRLRDGRVFTADDHADAEPVAIISAALADAHFDVDPVGQEIEIVGTNRRIVGVVATVRHFGPDQAPPPEMYVPAAQDPWLLGHVLVRPGDSFDAGMAREVAAGIDPAIPVQALFPYARFIRTWFAPLRFQLAIVGLLAGAGTVLALVGLYALIAYVVAARTRELGIRLALGETTRRLFRRVVTRGVVLAGAGLLLGTAGALSLRGFLRSLGTGIAADDPTVLAAVAILVLFAAGTAAAWPARRAARIDPATALRQE